MLDVNVRAPLALTAALLPELSARGGAIINVASTAAFQPVPGMGNYAAGKAFLLHWSLAMSEELRGRGVQVLCVCPGPTRTAFFQNAGMERAILPGAFGQGADAVVETAFKALARGRRLVVSGWTNKVTTFFASLAPRTLAARIAGMVVSKLRPGAEG